MGVRVNQAGGRLLLVVAGGMSVAPWALAADGAAVVLQRHVVALQQLHQQQQAQVQQVRQEQVQQVRRLDGLQQADQQLQQRVLVLEQEVQQLRQSVRAGTAEAARPVQPAGTASPPPAASQRQPAVPVSNDIPKSPAEAPVEENFARGRLSIEPQFSYSHYDTRELRLSGFLALDAIFLGDINLDRLRSDTYTFDLNTRYAFTPRLSSSLGLPFVSRQSHYFSGGAGGGASQVSEASRSSSFQLGDVTLGVSYRVLQEGTASPDVVASLTVKAPTGVAPYGIKLEKAPGQNNNLIIPSRLPTGNGVWAVSMGLSTIKTLDPAVVFASIGYTHNIKKHFRDISTAQGTVAPGEVKLGDSLSLGAGLAFAMNEKLSLGISASQVLAKKSRTRADGGAWNEVVGSNANSATLNVGLTYALSRQLSMMPNLAVGLTPDAPDYSFALKFPYSF